MDSNFELKLQVKSEWSAGAIELSVQVSQGAYFANNWYLLRERRRQLFQGRYYIWKVFDKGMLWFKFIFEMQDCWTSYLLRLKWVFSLILSRFRKEQVRIYMRSCSYAEFISKFLGTELKFGTGILDYYAMAEKIFKTNNLGL